MATPYESYYIHEFSIKRLIRENKKGNSLIIN